MVGVNTAPVVDAFGHGDAGDWFAPATRTAGVTVTCELMATAGFAWTLVGVSGTVTVRAIAGTGTAGADSVTESTKFCGVTAPPGTTTGGGAAGATTTGAAGAALRMMSLISSRRTC